MDSWYTVSVVRQRCQPGIGGVQVAVTIEDVAHRAGVSMKTVSRVINKEPFVADATRARVMAAVRELGYAPNVSAKRLASGRSYVLGLVFHNAAWTYINILQRGLLEECRKEGYGMLMNPSDIERPADQEEILRLVSQQIVDGFILTPPCDNNSSLLEKLQARGVPFVRVAPRDRDSSLPYVGPDDWQGGYDVTEHLLRLGHEHIGFVMGNPEHQASHDRLSGFKAALEAHDVPFRPHLVAQGDFNFESGLLCGRALLEADPRPTGIFACNDDMAAGVLAAAHQLSILVPEDLSVAGFDDVPLAQQVWPSLTTVHQPMYEMAQLAGQLLLRLLKDDWLDATHHVLPTSLVVRGSTGPRPST
jgi:LacI family transcriptional regulator